MRESDAMFRQFYTLLRESGRDRDAARAEAEQMVEFEQNGLAEACLVKNKWCECDGDKLAESRYYRREDGSHGWYHPECGGITQTG